MTNSVVCYDPFLLQFLLALGVTCIIFRKVVPSGQTAYCSAMTSANASDALAVTAGIIAIEVITIISSFSSYFFRRNTDKRYDILIDSERALQANICDGPALTTVWEHLRFPTHVTLDGCSFYTLHHILWQWFGHDSDFQWYWFRESSDPDRLYECKWRDVNQATCSFSFISFTLSSYRFCSQSSSVGRRAHDKLPSVNSSGMMLRQTATSRLTDGCDNVHELFLNLLKRGTRLRWSRFVDSFCLLYSGQPSTSPVPLHPSQTSKNNWSKGRKSHNSQVFSQKWRQCECYPSVQIELTDNKKML